MAKTRSQKAAAREARRRAEQGDDMGLAPIPKRQRGSRSNRYRESTSEPPEDPRMTVLTARCRQAGLAATPDNLIAVSAQMMGDQAGQAILIGARHTAEAEALWGTFVKLDRADEAYMRRIMHRARHPGGMRLEMLPERFEARADDDSPADPRSSAEKDDDARRAWRRWQSRLDCLSWAEGEALWDGIRLRCPLAKGRQLTGAGQAFVVALRLLHQMVQRA